MTDETMTPEQHPAEPLAEQLDEHQADAGEPDERDAELAKLRAELDGLKNPPPAPPAPEPADPRDRAILALKAELAAIRSTPEGAAAEMAKALDALRAEVDRMKEGKGLVPVASSDKPDPIIYGARLACGDIIDLQHPHATHWHCDTHNVTVPIKDVWPHDHLINSAA